MGVDEKALGQRLAKARRQAGLTQQELCQKAGLSYSTLAKIERGAIKSPSAFTVASIAQATGARLEDLFGMKATAGSASGKKTSKNGVRFVYFDVNGTLVRFFEKAFTQIADQSGRPIEAVETLFWRHDGAACRGEQTPAQINKIFARELGISGFDWLDYYSKNLEATPHTDQLLRWVGDNYELGLLTNNWPGFTKALLAAGLLPKADYKVVIESAEVKCAKPDPKIYKIAQDQAGFSASEILLVDDSAPYLTGADANGWHALRFDGFHPEQSVQRVKDALAF